MIQYKVGLTFEVKMNMDVARQQVNYVSNQYTDDVNRGRVNTLSVFLLLRPQVGPCFGRGSSVEGMKWRPQGSQVNYAKI